MRQLLIVILLLCSIRSFSQNSLIGYFHNWNAQDVSWIHPQNIDSRYSIIAIAFAMPASNSDMTMSFTPENMSPSAFKQAITQLQTQGKKVIISIGGATAYLDFPNDVVKQDFITSMNSIMDYYGFDGIDIDIEHGNCILINGGTIENPGNVSQVRLIDAIKSIMKYHRNTKGKKMMLTMAPETAYVQGGQSAFGSIWGGYLPIIHALRDSLDILQVQLYNSGTMYGIDRNIYAQGTADFIVAMTEAVIQGFSTAGGQFIGLPASKVAIGLPACNQAAGGGFVDTAIVSQATKYLLGKGSKPGSYSLISPTGYPTLKGMMTWSINWDAQSQCNGSYSFAGVYDKLFTNVPQPPGQITLLAPQYGQKMNTYSVIFRWSKQSNVIYDIEVLRGGTIIARDSTLTDTTYAISKLEYGQMHTWRVRAKNAQGWGQWNSPWTFTSRDLPLPSQVIAIAPENFAKVTKDSVIQFTWKSAQSKISSYVFTLKKGNEIFHTKSDIKDTVYSFALPDFDMTYAWSVQAVNASGTGLPSDQRFISTYPKPLDAPGIVNLLEPLAGEITSDSLLFIWSTSTPAITHYHLRIELDGATIFEDTSIIDTLHIVEMPNQSGNLLWKVRASNAAGYGSWSISDTISYRRLPPIPDATIFLIDQDSIVISSDSISLVWREVEFAESYQVEIEDLNSLILRDTISIANTLTLRNLRDLHQYRVRIRARNARGNAEWSKALHISVQIPVSSIDEDYEKPHIYQSDECIHIIAHKELPSHHIMKLYSLDGKSLISCSMKEQNMILSTNDLPKGIYVLQFDNHMQIINIH
jgi:chitinase